MGNRISHIIVVVLLLLIFTSCDTDTTKINTPSGDTTSTEKQDIKEPNESQNEYSVFDYDMLHCDVCFEVKPADKIRGMRAFLLSEDAHFYTLGFMTQSVNPDEILMMSYQSANTKAAKYYVYNTSTDVLAEKRWLSNEKAEKNEKLSEELTNKVFTEYLEDKLQNEALKATLDRLIRYPLVQSDIGSSCGVVAYDKFYVVTCFLGDDTTTRGTFIYMDYEGNYLDSVYYDTTYVDGSLTATYFDNIETVYSEFATDTNRSTLPATVYECKENGHTLAVIDYAESSHTLSLVFDSSSIINVFDCYKEPNFDDGIMLFEGSSSEETFDTVDIHYNQNENEYACSFGVGGSVITFGGKDYSGKYHYASEETIKVIDLKTILPDK